MNKLPKFVWVMAAVIAVFAVWHAVFPSYTWRYKMTVEVETPEGIKTGSAVREVSMQQGLNLTPQMHPRITLKGEAVVVDLGQRGVLFALQSGDYGSDIMFEAFPGKEKKGSVKLTPGWYPKFVRFRDINDPKTVENLLDVKVCKEKIVDGKCIEDETYVIRREQRENNSYIKEDHFAEAFGAGVKLKSVTIEMTDEPVTWGIDQYLPKFDGKPHLVNLYDFRQGDK